ncbi:MAG: hypothetical protein GY943_25145 [Chloroflexi bacterium]|nr:hypothetical protein [Chloroflexota bacterium]
MTAATKTIANVTLSTDKPTLLAFDDLFTWVIWQFPKATQLDGLCGAVKPPIADHDWYPAIVQYKKKRVLVYAHLSQTFTTPEYAAEHVHLQNNG